VSLHELFQHFLLLHFIRRWQAHLLLSLVKLLVGWISVSAELSW
jgi:hypothetical protein